LTSLLSKYYKEFHEERGKAGTVLSPERISFIIEKVGKGNKVLDMGCRYGDLTAYYTKDNDVTGVDIDENALKICKQKLGIKTHLQNLNERLEFDDNSFHVVVLSEVLEHLPYPNITLGEVKRVLKEKGTLVGSVPNGTRVKNRLRFFFKGVIEADRTHIQHFSHKSLRQLLEKHFSSVEMKLIGGRFISLSASMFANYILFSAMKCQL
jgi:ubiquinone/menaquinone biosynthesis C-methylase UbiE